jgi:succinyl-diaminopimelate desuccinylase
MSKTIELAKALISCPSVTPNDVGCQELLIQKLQSLHFNIERLQYGDVTNLWARRGQERPLFVFAGHTDVVPPGPKDQWKYDPFDPQIENDYLYGRGATDMKSSIAAMVIACEQFIHHHPHHSGSIAFLITSDEEGVATHGTVKVLEHLAQQKQIIDWCLVGEATSSKIFGDTIKNGRRGSLNGKLIIHGKQGHIAYPELGNNPIHAVSSALVELTQQLWDKGDDFFPATQLQISNIHAGTGADNVIPNDLEILFNFRYSPAVTAEKLKSEVERILTDHHLRYTLTWRLSGEPFLTQPGTLVEACQKAIHQVTGNTASLSTSGGTSDGRFIAKTGCQVIEFGPCNESAHKINECIRVADLENLTHIYFELLKNVFGEK